MKLELRDIEIPDFGIPQDVPVIPSSVYEERCNKAYEAAAAKWLIVYGDREHFGNLFYLSGFDPRFEEALLIMGPNKVKYLLVGNEGYDYSARAKINTEVLLCQSFSLMGQDRSQAPRLDHILKDIGLEKNDQVGICGWKYLEENEKITGSSTIFVPAMIVECIRSVVECPTSDVTEILMHPSKGIRAYNEVEEIVSLEFGASRSSLAVMKIIEGLKTGMTEFQAVSNMGYAGEPLTAHVMFSAGKDTIIGLSSPTSKKIALGDGVTTAVGYWGGLSCRAGLVAEEDEAFLKNLAKPYFKGVSTWYENAAIGMSGGTLFEKVSNVLAEGGLRPALNPGHLTSTDEWMHTLVRPNSEEEIQSGMGMQLDIIPAPLSVGKAVNCEDSVVFADKALQDQLKATYPEVWERIRQRRLFLKNEIGLAIDDSLLPLSSNPGCFQPFWLSPDKMLTQK
ncbi:hypothetical protein ACFSMW_17955 [Virgibacillus halophilus]|uniref:Xaa-Pro aminopeptidase n=1 Tax=Tigheibacillus halophilus TaxID=361280 RepID=A0ABU5C3P3_9BACI|nr:hypothetical protein [Virgibacillus halophilus]